MPGCSSARPRPLRLRHHVSTARRRIAIRAAEPDARSLALLAGSRVLSRSSSASGPALPTSAERVEGGPGRRRHKRIERRLWRGRGVGPRGMATRLGDPAPRSPRHVPGSLRGRGRAGSRVDWASFRRDAQGVAVGLGLRPEACERAFSWGPTGAGSLVRELAGIGCDHWDYGQGALCCVVEHERPHENRVREWLRPGGPLALLPLPGGRSGVTWAEPIRRVPARWRPCRRPSSWRALRSSL